MNVGNSEMEQTDTGISNTGDTLSNNQTNIDNGQDAVDMSLDNNDSTRTDSPPCPQQNAPDLSQQVHQGNDTMPLATDKGNDHDGDIQNNDLPDI